MYFLSQCLVHNEKERKDISELLDHPYLKVEFEKQTKLTPKMI